MNASACFQGNWASVHQSSHAVLQLEFSPLNTNPELILYCRQVVLAVLSTNTSLIIAVQYLIAPAGFFPSVCSVPRFLENQDLVLFQITGII